MSGESDSGGRETGWPVKVRADMGRDVIEAARRLGAPISPGAHSPDAFYFALGTLVAQAPPRRQDGQA